MGQAERQSMRHMPLLSSVDGAFWGSLVRPNWAIETKRMAFC